MRNSSAADGAALTLAPGVGAGSSSNGNRVFVDDSNWFGDIELETGRSLCADDVPFRF